MSRISEQIADALEETGVSIRELARRLAVQEGSQPEAKRRWLMKILSGSVASPTPGRLRQIEAALGIEPGSLQAPPRTRRVGPAAASLSRVVSLLEKNPDSIQHPEVQALLRVLAAEYQSLARVHVELAARLNGLLADGDDLEETAQ